MASDPICFYGESDKYYTLEDGQFALLKKGGFEVYDKELNRILPKEELTENLRVEDSSVDGYFMLKEIDETPKALKRLAKFYREKEIFKKINKNLLKDIKDIKIIGCGTAYNSGLVGADYLRRVLGKDVNCYIASEFRYSYPNINKETLCIFVSQSGETADTIECLNLCKQKRAKILTITNVEHSTLAKTHSLHFLQRTWIVDADIKRPVSIYLRQ